MLLSLPNVVGIKKNKQKLFSFTQRYRLETQIKFLPRYLPIKSLAAD